MHRSWARSSALALSVAVAVLALPGCSKRAPTPSTSSWMVGRLEPRFDPDGPPNPTRWALERLLTYGLVREDSSGAVVPAAAERVEVSNDSLVYAFHLRRGLTFTDGTPCRSADFRRALVAGLGRTDHSTRDWLLAAVRGVGAVRAGRPLPEIGIEASDDSTLVIHLARVDPELLAKLALPGVSDPWRDRRVARWVEACGLGPYRTLRADSTRRLTLLRVATGAESTTASPDTIHVRFQLGAARVRSLLRQIPVDLVWPLPPGLLSEDLPAGYGTSMGIARPPRRLLLVMRADLPPTSRLPTRHALAHGINRRELLRSLLPVGREVTTWLKGASTFDFPKLDQAEIRRWMEAAKLGRSFHVTMAYDADGLAAMIARDLQGEWSRASIYIEMVPLRGEAVEREFLRGGTHLILVDSQSLLDDPVAEVRSLVMPLRGPAVGTFRTGWRTREMDPWIAPVGAPPAANPEAMQARLEEERIALPLAELSWMWVERSGGATIEFHPHFGPCYAY